MKSEIAALIAKWPQPGEVKTRLASSLGERPTLKIYEQLLENSLTACRPDSLNNYSFGCFVDPPSKVETFSQCYQGQDFYYGQSGQDLGIRMSGAISLLFEKHKASKVILIGADIPDITSDIISEAFALLDISDLVFGPTSDGGYYLIGMKSLYDNLFRDIEWGGNRVMDMSQAIAEKEGLSVQLLKELDDLDTIDDLKKFPQIAKKAHLP